MAASPPLPQKSPSQARSILSFFGGNLSATAFSLFAGLLVTRWTEPRQLGLWNFALLLATYASVLQLGVFNGLNRQLPYYRGKQDTEAVQRAAEVAYAWCLALSAATAGAMFLAALVCFYLGRWEALQTALAIGVVLAFSWSLQYFTVTYVSSSSFGPLARRTTLVAMVGLPLALLAQAFGYLGLLARAVLLATANSLALAHERPVRVRPRWHGPSFRELMSIGFPIWLLGQLGALFMTLDRVMLAHSPQLLGYYAIAGQFSALVAMVPSAFSAVVYPDMAQHFGTHHHAFALWRKALRLSVWSGAASLAVAAVCWFAIPPFVHHVLPAYVPGIEAAQWAAFTGVAMVLSIFGNTFNILGRQVIYLACSGFGLAAFAATWFVLTRVLMHDLLTSAAQSMLAGTFTTSLLSMIASAITCKKHDRQQAASAA